MTQGPGRDGGGDEVSGRGGRRRWAAMRLRRRCLARLDLVLAAEPACRSSGVLGGGILPQRSVRRVGQLGRLEVSVELFAPVEQLDHRKT
eukprot:5228734-Pyramimonas_sp.AAC.1